LLLGVQGNHPELAHHNIFFSPDYRREFKEIFEEGIPPSQPTIYLAITSKATADDAPPGCENWFVLVNAPALGRWDWETQAASYGDLVLAQLAARGFDVRGRIEVKQTLTPFDLERMTGARRGALYGASSNNRWAAFRRPHNRAPDVEGLYFAGGTTHPGGGVPMVTLSGKVASQLLLQDDLR
jgi:phytoene dehydrogenase-like protein